MTYASFLTIDCFHSNRSLSAANVGIHSREVVVRELNSILDLDVLLVASGFLVLSEDVEATVGVHLESDLDEGLALLVSIHASKFKVCDSDAVLRHDLTVCQLVSLEDLDGDALLVVVGVRVLLGH